VSVVRTSDAGPERENTLNPNAPQRMTSLHRMKTDGGKGSPGKSSAMQRLRRMVTGVQGQTEQEADMRQAELVEGGASEHKRVEWSQVLKHLQREKKRATARAPCTAWRAAAPSESASSNSLSFLCSTPQSCS
jgi:hypothetical protein